MTSLKAKTTGWCGTVGACTDTAPYCTILHHTMTSLKAKTTGWCGTVGACTGASKGGSALHEGLITSGLSLRNAAGLSQRRTGRHVHALPCILYYLRRYSSTLR